MLLDNCLSAGVRPNSPYHENKIGNWGEAQSMTKREVTEFIGKLSSPNLNLKPLPEPFPAQHFMDKIKDAS